MRDTKTRAIDFLVGLCVVASAFSIVLGLTTFFIGHAMETIWMRGDMGGRIAAGGSGVFMLTIIFVWMMEGVL